MYVPGGLFLAKRWSTEKAVEHYAIIGPGLYFGFPGTWGSLVLELMPGGPEIRHLGRDENWKLEPIQDSAGARLRIRELLSSGQRRRYDLISNNCEHWARFIAYGAPQSEQVKGIAFAAALVAGLIFFGTKGASRA